MREDSNKFKCANCGGNHKSNFWECPSRKKVLNSRAKLMTGNSNRIPDSTGRNFSNAQISKPVTGRAIHTHHNSQTNFAARQRVASTSVNSNFSNVPTYANIAAGRQNFSSQNEVYTHVPTENNGHVADSGSMTASDFDFLTEQLHHMIDAMFKANTIPEAVQVGIKYTQKIVIGLRFNGSK